MTRRLPARRLWAEGYAIDGDHNAYAGQPRTLTWSEVHDDGTECVRTGRVWSACARVPKVSAYWVRADHDAQMWCVARAGRRLGVGRVRGGKWRAGRGRVMEEGEWFTECHPHSPTGSLTHAARTRISLPTVIRVEPLPAHILAYMSEPK